MAVSDVLRKAAGNCELKVPTAQPQVPDSEVTRPNGPRGGQVRKLCALYPYPRLPTIALLFQFEGLDGRGTGIRQLEGGTSLRHCRCRSASIQGGPSLRKAPKIHQRVPSDSPG